MNIEGTNEEKDAFLDKVFLDYDKFIINEK